MPITLEQAKVGLKDKVNQEVIDEFRRGSFILNKLQFDDTVCKGTGGSTLAYGYVQLLTPAVASGRAINGEYTPGEAVKTEKLAKLKIMGGSFEVDRVLENTAAKSEIAFQLDQKTKATTNKFHYLFVNGDSAVDSKDFDGIDKLITGSSTDYSPGAVIDVSTAAKIKENASELDFELSNWLKTLDGKPSALLCNSRTATVLSKVAKELGFYSREKNAFGEMVEFYGTVPIVDMETYFDGTTTKDVIEITETGVTSIYAVTLSLDGVHGISVNGSSIVKTYLPDLNTPGAVKKGEVEIVAGIVIKNSKKAGAFRNIKVR